ncbi:MAG: MFS transporter [Candidatus Hodarchaeales archaeon]|jgi:GPH family glycoside/pentoside/hexuronide:cation symporter
MGEVIEIKHSRLNMASYGFGKFLTEFMEMAFTVWLYSFYVRTIGVDSLIIGLAVIIYAIWNAVNDPLVGYLTNKPFKFTKKWGRRFPWIMIGGVAYILSYILIFTPPNVDPQSGAWIFFIWFIVSTAIFDTFNSIFFVNFASLFPDKFRSVEERRKATGIQTPIGIVGVALGALLPPLIIDQGVPSTFITNAGLVVIIGLIVLMLSIPGSREDQVTIDRYLEKHDTEDRASFFRTLKLSLKQKSFLFFIITYTLYRSLVISFQASIPFFVEFILEKDVQTLLSAGFLVGALVSSPIWAYVAQKTNSNKKVMLINSLLLTIFTIPFIFLNSVEIAMIVMILWGFGLGGFWTMLAPTFGDVINESIVKNQKRQEGIFNGFLQFFGRLAILVQAISFASIHTITGFVEGRPLVDQPLMAVRGIHVHFALLPAIFMLTASIIFWAFYDLTPDKVILNQKRIIELNL